MYIPNMEIFHMNLLHMEDFDDMHIFLTGFYFPHAG